MGIMKPRIAVPMGDPAGIGPEIVVKALADPSVYKAAEVIVVGDKGVLEKAMRIFCGADLKISPVGSSGECRRDKKILNLMDLDNVDQSRFEYGKVSAMCGQAAFDYISRSIDLANARQVDAVATTPINKEALKAAGIPYIGHTEIFGARTNTPDPLTMFEVRGMRVFFHYVCSLRQAQDMITKDRTIDYVLWRCTKVLRPLA